MELARLADIIRESAINDSSVGKVRLARDTQPLRLPNHLTKQSLFPVHLNVDRTGFVVFLSDERVLELSPIRLTAQEYWRERVRASVVRVRCW
jgi:hypothetical protein